MLQTLTLLENELPVPAPVFGLIGFAALMLALAVVLHVGGSRPHS